MAQLYKMTLYVCDLTGDVDLRDIKNRIEERALQGRMCNCIGHFSGEKIGPKIEWDDDIPLNGQDCPTSEWEKYFE